MTGQFVESGVLALPPTDTENALQEFVRAVLSRLERHDDPRVAKLRANWKAIIEADEAEATFCASAGRMGLDPYEAESWDPALTNLLESGLGDGPDKPMVADFLEATDVENAVSQWRWVAELQTSLELSQGSRTSDFMMRRYPKPAENGYDLAQQVRTKAKLGPDDALPELGAVAQAIGIGSFLFQERNHLSTTGIRAAVGWSHGQNAVVAGPLPSRPDNRRFLEACGLYHALFACEYGPRLVTRAHTWEQQAARAFGAELLAPREAMIRRSQSLDREADSTQFLEGLARDFKVSTKVIEHQLQNAGIDLVTE